jgi:hypothetical protein
MKVAGQPLLKQHMWVLVSLTVIGLAYFLIIDFGNAWGWDEWAFIYSVVDKHTLTFLDGRPFNLFAFWLVFRGLSVHPAIVHGAFIALKIGTAFVLYLLVRLFSSEDPLFAFVCGLVFLTYLVRDEFMIREIEMVSTLAWLIYCLLALYYYFRYMSHHRPVWLILSLVLLLLAIVTKEIVAPLLALFPTVVFVARRDFSRGRLIGIAAWLAAILLASIPTIVTLLGLASGVYLADTTSLAGEPLTLGELVRHSWVQTRFGLLNPLLLDRPSLLEYRFPAMITVAVMLVVTALLRGKLVGRVEWPGISRSRLRNYLIWLGVGLVAMWLGFLPFILGGIAAATNLRVHQISIIGEAIAISAAIWFASHLVKNVNGRWLVRVTALAVVVAYGTAQAGRIQIQYYYALEATWENQAYFVRSLAHLAPSVEENTLFVYVEDPDLPETPFVTAFGFQYAMRYLYENQASGFIINGDLPYWHEVEVSDEGVEVVPIPTITEHVIREDAFYGWDEVIFITKMSSGRVVLLDELPPEYHTEERANLYSPRSRIQHTFIPERVQELSPPVQPAAR